MKFTASSRAGSPLLPGRQPRNFLPGRTVLPELSFSGRCKWLPFLFIWLLVSVRAVAQQITLTEKDVPVEQALKDIGKQSGHVFMYDKQELQGIRVNFSVQRTSITEVLDRCFKDVPLTYEIENKSVVITKKQPGRAPATSDTVYIHGRVTDEDGTPLVGAYIVIDAFKKATATNEHGQFTLTGFPNRNFNMNVSYIGYVTRTVPGSAHLDRIVLVRKNKELDEARVVGYGTESRRFSVGATVKIGSDVIERQPVTNVLSALQGQVPGLNVTTASGVPGS